MPADVQILGTLYVSSPRARLTLDHSSVKVITEQDEVHQFPLVGLDSIIAFAPNNVSIYLIERLAELGKPLSLFDYRGRFQARIVGPTAGNVHVRVAQVEASVDEERSLSIAREMVLGKIRNSRRLLQRRARDLREAAPTALPTAIERMTTIGMGAKVADNVDSLRGHEGDAAAVYFGVFRHLVTIPGRDFILESRERRPPRGRMNALLSFLYSILTFEAIAAVEGVGLDPQVGFLHATRSGKPSLALDVMEELRAPLVDRLALRLVNLRALQPDHFTLKEGGAVYLNPEGRKVVLTAWAERRQELVAHPAMAEKIPWGLVVHTQAKLLSRYLRGEVPEYTAFLVPS